MTKVGKKKTQETCATEVPKGDYFKIVWTAVAEGSRKIRIRKVIHDFDRMVVIEDHNKNKRTRLEK